MEPEERIVVTIGKYALSDLFFNYRTDHLDGAYAASSEPLSDEDVATALCEDAKEFAMILGHPELVDWLVNDYMGRR